MKEVIKMVAKNQVITKKKYRLITRLLAYNT